MGQSRAVLALSLWAERSMESQIHLAPFGNKGHRCFSNPECPCGVKAGATCWRSAVLLHGFSLSHHYHCLTSFPLAFWCALITGARWGFRSHIMEINLRAHALAWCSGPMGVSLPKAARIKEHTAAPLNKSSLLIIHGRTPE